MFIQTEALPDPDRLKFFPGEPVLPRGSAEFPDEEAAERAPLAARLFEIDGVEGVTLHTDHVVVEKDSGLQWQVLKPLILGAIMDHYTSGDPAMFGADGDSGDGIESEIRELLDTRIRPAAQQTGGDVTFHSFVDGVLYLELSGGAHGLLGGITNVMAHYVPEVKAVKDHRDSLPKPGLETDEARAIQQLLDERINPAVASHGGHVTLIDVQKDTAYLRLEGGCQGCGMADVTLKQGIETEIMSAVPSIAHVYDVTDHASGTNPYYAG